jgi:hypothetical protein
MPSQLHSVTIAIRLYLDRFILGGEKTMRDVCVHLYTIIIVVTISSGVLAAREAWGQAPAPPSPSSPTTTSTPAPFLLTIFLRPDQSKTSREINAQLRQTGYYTKFPPPGIEVVSWYVMMGLGQVVTLRVPAERLREVNRAVAETAWGTYHTEFYPTYDYKPIAEEQRRSAQ